MSDCPLTLAQLQELMNELREAEAIAPFISVDFSGDNIEIEIDPEYIHTFEEINVEDIDSEEEQVGTWRQANCSTTVFGFAWDSRRHPYSRYRPQGWHELTEEIENYCKEE